MSAAFEVFGELVQLAKNKISEPKINRFEKRVFIE